ncbi:MAG: hypothetical protein WC793_01405 [Candidatus Paceibacterota bacterium]|jgi:DNA-binding beta-propeller fold protein YncE
MKKGHASIQFILATFAIIFAGMSGLFFYGKLTQAAAATFLQSSWLGGATVNTATHALNQTGWTEYNTETGTSASATVTLPSTSYAFTDDGTTSITPASPIVSGGGFTNGTNSSTVVSGSGVGASVGLSASSSAGAKTDYAVGPSPFGVLFDNVTNSIWVANNGSNTVTKLNATTGAVVGTYTVGIGPSRLSFDTVTNSIWVTNSGSDNISKINVNTGAIVGTFAVGLGPQDITFDSLTNSVWVANLGFGANTVSKVDINTGTKNDYVIDGPIGITFDSFTGSVWVTSSTVSNNLIKLNATTGAVLGTYTVGTSGVGGVVFDSITNSVWVTDANNNTVIKVNVSTGAIVGTYAVGIGPNYPAFDDLNSSIWTPNVVDNTISQIDINTGAVLNTYIVGTSPGNLIFDSFTDSMWVSSGFDNIVSKVNIATAYAASGTFTSAVIDTGAKANFTTLAYTTTLPALTSITVDVRAGNVAIPDGTWTAWTTNVVSGGSIGALAGNRYIQYRANLATTDTTVTPALSDVTINYSQYGASGNLTSSVFDSSSATNKVTKLAWATSGTSSTEIVKFQVRSSADNVTWSNWCGPALACDGTDYFLDANNDIAFVSNHPLTISDNDRYFQYKAFLSSGGAATPTLSSVTVSYDTNVGAPSPTGGGGIILQTPKVITNSATSITDTDATLNGNVDPNGTSDTTRWFEWGTSETILNNETTHNSQGSAVSDFSDTISGLTKNTTYYFRAVAKNSSGKVEGSILSFTTKNITDFQTPLAPVVTVTANPTSIPVNGTSVITFSTQNVTNGCIKSGNWSGSTEGSGTYTTNPLPVGIYTYTLTCTGGLGRTGSGSVVVTVESGTSGEDTSGGSGTGGGTGGSGTSGGTGGSGSSGAGGGSGTGGSTGGSGSGAGSGTGTSGGAGTGGGAGSSGVGGSSSGEGNSSIDSGQTIISNLVNSILTPEIKKAITTTRKNITEFSDTPVGNATTTTVTALGAGGGSAIALASVGGEAASFADIPFMILRLWSVLLVSLGLRKKRAPWGTVYDSVTKQPLDPVYVVLNDNTGKEVQTAITDLDGRFGFLVPPGSYQISTKKTNYRAPSAKLAGKMSDELYDNLYFGGEVLLGTNEVIIKNIPMDPLAFDWNEFAKRDKKLMMFYSKNTRIINAALNALFYIGLISVIGLFISRPDKLNLAILIVYGILLALHLLGFKPKTFGTIIDSATKAPLSYAVIRVFRKGFPQEIFHRVADKYGHYYCLLAKGEYHITIDRKNPDESYTTVYTSGLIDAKKGIINENFVA